MDEKHTILGIHITNRLQEAVEVQKVLTGSPATIKTRLGLHEVEKDDKQGIVLLEMLGGDEDIQKLADSLNAIEGVEVQSMVFHHPA